MYTAPSIQPYSFTPAPMYTTTNVYQPPLCTTANAYHPNANVYHSNARHNKAPYHWPSTPLWFMYFDWFPHWNLFIGSYNCCATLLAINIALSRATPFNRLKDPSLDRSLDPEATLHGPHEHDGELSDWIISRMRSLIQILRRSFTGHQLGCEPDDFNRS